MTRFDLFDFIKRVIDIQTILKIQVESGIGYIVFSSDKCRKLAKELLKGKKIKYYFFYIQRVSKSPHHNMENIFIIKFK